MMNSDHAKILLEIINYNSSLEQYNLGVDRKAIIITYAFKQSC